MLHGGEARRGRAALASLAMRGAAVARVTAIRAVVIAAVATVALAPGAAAAVSRVVSVRSVSDPPSLTPAALRLRVGGTARAVAVYASPGRIVGRGAVLLAGRVRVRGQRIAVRVPRGLAAGAWFIVVCPAGSRHGCVASRRQMVKLPRRFSAPVQVHPVPETGQAASATMGSAGGTLTATAANGTRFRLDIPAKSVPDGTQITITPLSSLSGARWVGRLIGAVQLAPEGLVLVHGATLTITPARPVPVRDQVAVGYTGGGSDLHEVPLAPTTKQIQIPLAHFSGVGLGDSPGGPPPPSTGSTILDFYSQLIAEALHGARDGQSSEQEAFDQALSWLQDALGDVMREEVPPGLNDDSAAQMAIRDLLEIARTSEMLSGSDGTFKEVTPTIIKLMEGVYKRAQQRCAENHDLTQIPTILDADREEQMLNSPKHDIAEDLKCERFKVEFNSQISDSGGAFDGTYDLATSSTPTVSYDQATAVIDGQASISYMEASGSKTQTFDCPDGSNGSWTETDTVVGSQPGTLRALKLALPDPSQIGQPNAANSVTLVIDPGKPQETIHADRSPQCGEGPSGTGPTPFWWAAFMGTPLASDSPGTGFAQQPYDDGLIAVFTLPLENYTPDMAHAVYAGSTTSDTGDAINEQVTIDVIHTPPAP